MCGIAGFFNPKINFRNEECHWLSVLDNMNQAQIRRGPDGNGTFLRDTCGLAHVRLAIIDLKTGHQPLIRTEAGCEYAITFNGEIYNMADLKAELIMEGATFTTTSDTEVILVGYMRHGKDFVKKLNGIFAFAIWDSATGELSLFRDRLGVKPLFYTYAGDTFVFASEIKGLFAFPCVRPVVDRNGLCEIFALGPAKSYGRGVFRDILEALPGECITVTPKCCHKSFYWMLESRPHEDSMEETVAKTAWLIGDAVKMQMLSDIPISTFLSGGVDSSLVTAICAKELGKTNKKLNTFSFDFKDNNKYFQANSYQPSEDRPYVDKMVDFAGTSHRYLECTNLDQFNCLFDAVNARDLPCMADVESSMLYFCSLVKEHNKVTLTGECADEIFGGYPWFHSQSAFETDAFPWSANMAPRQVLLDDTLIADLNMEEYSRAAYEKTVAETPVLAEDSATEKRRREISFLNLRWFMTTLLDRMDRTSMYNGLEARVPLADHRILEYVFNVPWHMKCPTGPDGNCIVKGLLRFASVDYLPHDILWRRKSPYPKTYDPNYEKLLADNLKEVIANPSSPIRAFLNTRKVHAFLNSPSDYGKPWYGQLMAGPQMLAYMLQVNYWLEKYNVQVVI